MVISQGVTKVSIYRGNSRNGRPRTSTDEGTTDVVLENIVLYVWRLPGHLVASHTGVHVVNIWSALLKIFTFRILE